MLPRVAAEDRRGALDEWAFAVCRLHHFDPAELDREPAPARSELGDAGRNEILLHLRHRPEVGYDLLFEVAGHPAAARLHPFPEMQVIVVLPGIVEERRIGEERALDHVLDRPAFELGALHQIVAVVDLGEVMPLIRGPEAKKGAVR